MIRVYRYGFPLENKKYSFDELKQLAREYLEYEVEGEVISLDKHYHVEHGTGSVTVRSYDSSLEEINGRLQEIRKIFSEYEENFIETISKEMILKMLDNLYDEIYKPDKFRSKKHHIAELRKFQILKPEAYYHEIATAIVLQA